MEIFPDELLSEVFCHYVDLNQSPWRLTFVNKRWQHVALGTPALWTHIIIDDNEANEILGEGWRYLDRGASLCHTVEQFRNAVNRVGALLLHIHLSLSYDEVVAEVVNEVFSDSITRRTSSILFSVSCGFEESPQWRIPNFNSFTNLETLLIHSMPNPWMTAFLESSSSSASLRNLELPKICMNEEQVKNTIHRFPNLERLRGHDSWPNEKTRGLSLPHVTELVISPFNPFYIRRLYLPQLRSLTLSDLPRERPNSTEAISPLELPLLQDLRLESTRYLWCLHDVLAPRLQTLSLIGIAHLSPTSERFRSFSTLSFPTVKRLHLQTERSNRDRDKQDLFLIAALQAVPNVKSIVMSTYSRNTHSIKLRLPLLNRLGSTDMGDTLCPHLRDLELRLYNPRSLGLVEEEVCLLKRIVDGREQVGQGLERFVVEWTNEVYQVVNQQFV